MAEGIEQIAIMIRALLASLPEPCIQPYLEDFPATLIPRPTAPASLPVLQFFKPASHPISRHLHAIAGSLAWSQTYMVEDFGPDFLQKYGWTEIIGPRGAIPSARLACGFLLLGPDVEYPDHRHSAEELYIVISGTAAWRRGAEDWREQPPGAVIHHPSGIPHAMRTANEALLALYLWRGGDLQQKSIF
jgi:mannose-6-phosphate isomerase-like protein (cupin superfamily)